MIKERVADCATIVLADAVDHQLLTDGLGCGASGYLTKECSLSELIDAVRTVARGEMLIPPRMLGPLLSELLREVSFTVATAEDVDGVLAPAGKTEPTVSTTVEGDVSVTVRQDSPLTATLRATRMPRGRDVLSAA